MPPLRSLDILGCAPHKLGAIVGAFPRLEELGLHLGGDCSALIRLQKSLRRLCVRLSDESTAEELAKRVLPHLTLILHLGIIVPRQSDVAAAEQRFRGLCAVRCCTVLLGCAGHGQQGGS